MKIRTGFVSNSSTTSFMVYGWALDDLDISAEDILAKFAPNMLKEYKGYEKDEDAFCQMWMDFMHKKNPFGRKFKDVGILDGVIKDVGQDYIGIVIANFYSDNCCLQESKAFPKYFLKKVQRAEKTHLKKLKKFREEMNITKEPKLIKGVWNW